MAWRRKKAAADTGDKGVRAGGAAADEQASSSAADNGRRPVFLPLVLAVMLVLLGIYLAIHLGLVSTRFMSELNHPDPPLAEAEPALGPGPRRLARRVAVVVIDGLRLADSYGLPYLDELRRAGVDTSATSHYPSISRPNHITIVTGVPPAASGVRTNAYSAPVELDSLMDRASAMGMQSAFTADYTDGIPLMFSRSRVGDDGRREYDNAFYDANMATWPGGFAWSLQRQVVAGYPLIVAIAGGVDAAGHQYGGDSVEYRAATRRVDTMLAEALAGLDLRNDALIITADHGHTDPGGHGGLETEVMEVPLIMVGAGVRPGAAVVDAQLIDIAPTAAALLGLSAPGHGLGRVLTEALTLDDDSRAQVVTADKQRVTRNTLLVASWHGEGRKRVAGARIWRVPLIAVAVALGVCFLIVAGRLGALKIDWRVLLISLPSFPLSYYAMVMFFGQQFSPSFVPERGNVEELLARFGLISTAAHIVVSWFALHSRLVLAERLAIANGVFMSGLLASLATLGVMWAVWPGPYYVPPSPTVFVLIPATYVAGACYALAVVATLTLEIVVFFARAVDPRIMAPGDRSRRRRR